MPATTLLRQDQRQSHAVSSIKTSAANTLEARLALTGRYKPCKPPSLQELNEAVKDNKDWKPACSRPSQLNYKLNPPGRSLIMAALELLDEVSGFNDSTPTTHLTILSDLLMLLEEEEQEPPFVSCSSSSHDSSDMDSVMVTPLQLRNLFTCLTQPSFQSWTLQEGRRSDRARNMAEASLRGGGNLVMDIPTWHISERDSDLVIWQNDFLAMRFGQTSQKFDSLDSRREKEECDQGLLVVRMMLRCEPFIVVCEGATHMGSFMQLARSAELHLELLPSAPHVRYVKRLLLNEGVWCPAAAHDIQLLVSCSPQTEKQQAMTEIPLNAPYIISEGVTWTHACTQLATIVSNARLAGLPLIIESSTNDLPKVMLALYAELLSSQKAVSLMVVEPERRGNWHGAPSHDMGNIEMLAERVVNPDVFQKMGDSLHFLLVA